MLEQQLVEVQEKVKGANGFNMINNSQLIVKGNDFLPSYAQDMAGVKPRLYIQEEITKSKKGGFKQ